MKFFIVGNNVFQIYLLLPLGILFHLQLMWMNSKFPIYPLQLRSKMQPIFSSPSGILYSAAVMNRSNFCKNFYQLSTKLPWTSSGLGNLNIEYEKYFYILKQ